MIIVNINPEETYVRAAGLWQYDYGQVLRIQGLSLPPAIEIHFSLQETGGEAITRIGVTKDGVTDVVIPDSILDGAGAIEDYFAYAFIYPSDDNSGQTEHRIEIGVKSRPRPEGYKGSGDDTMGAIMKAVNEIAAGKADGLEYKNSILRLMAGETELAQVTISGGSGTGSDAREIELQKSETAIQWRYVGDETWKDLVDLADLKGDPGPQGPAGSAGKDGSDGAPGKNGADGKSAYQYAVDGGYTGTEDDFKYKLAKEYAEPIYKVILTADDTAPVLEPGKKYIFPDMASLAYTLVPPDDETESAIYWFIFGSPADAATTVTHPEGVTVSGPTISAGKRYEISIADGLAIIKEWEAAI